MGKRRKKPLTANSGSKPIQTARPSKKTKTELTPANPSSSQKKRKHGKDSNPKPDKHSRPNSSTDEQEFVEIDNMDWSEVVCPDSVFLGDDLGGFLCLEEIDGVDVEYKGDDKVGKVVKFKKVKGWKQNSNKRGSAKPEEPLSIEETQKYYDLDEFNEESVAKLGDAGEQDDATTSDKAPPKNLDNQKDGLVNENGSEDVDDDDERAAVGDSDTDEKMKISESEQKTPQKKQKKGQTQIVEEQNIPLKDSPWSAFNLFPAVLEALESLTFTKPTPIQEKALPFGLSGRDVIGTAETGSGKTLAFGIPILQHLLAMNEKERECELAGLILTPTRELTIQVKDHLKDIGKHARLKIMTIVGGMSVQKQNRLLSQKPNIIVATPGRLWDIISADSTFLNRLRSIRFLVLDEADRMLEKNHFNELSQILTVLSRKRVHTDEWGAEAKVSNIDLPPRQTFVFSATLDASLKEDLKKKRWKSKSGDGGMDKDGKSGTMEELMGRLEFQDEQPAFVDVTSDDVVPESLEESKVDCTVNDKDVYVYYFVLRYPGRTLIFVNSIDAIRRLVPVMRLLSVEVLGLHAQMQQKQRLKNLDRFKANEKAVMVASDVAARGLDIPMVEHVIHYQLPRSGDIYVHRSGRTARARKSGISLMLCSPEEQSLYKKICYKLKKAGGLPDFPVEHDIVKKLKQRINLAKQIDAEEHRLQKVGHDDDWYKRAAKELEIDIDEDLLKNADSSETKEKKQRIKSLKTQLKSLLSQPVIPRGISTKYITSGVVRDLADRLLDEKTRKL